MLTRYLHFIGSGLWFINALMWAFNVHSVGMTILSFAGVIGSALLAQGADDMRFHRERRPR